MLKEIFDTIKSDLLAEFKTGEAQTPPAQIILSSPANGFNTGNISDADFAWNAAADADVYRIQIAADTNFQNIIYDQDNISYLKHTVPDGILNNDTQYYWRINGKNKYGAGAWSGYRSWLASATFQYEDEAIALFSRMTTQPDVTRKGLINTLIKGLKDDGVWAKLDALWVFACHTNNDSEAMLNWIKTKHQASVFGTGNTFTIDRGILTGSGTTNYIVLNFNPLSDGVRFQQNSANIFIYSRTNSASGGYDFGGRDSGSTYWLTLASRFSDNKLYLRLNCATGSQVNIAVTNSLGTIGANRSDANTIQIRKGNSELLSTAQASVAFKSIGSILGNYNQFDLPAQRQYSAAGIGGSLSLGEWQNLNSKLEIFLNAIGAGVQ
jgi:hypothetical protein